MKPSGTEYVKQENGEWKRVWITKSMAEARARAKEMARENHHILAAWEAEEQGCAVTYCVQCELPVSVDLLEDEDDQKVYGRPLYQECIRVDEAMRIMLG